MVGWYVQYIFIFIIIYYSILLAGFKYEIMLCLQQILANAVTTVLIKTP